VNLAETHDCAADAASDSTLENCLDAALLAMDPDDRKLIERFYFDRLSQKELGEQLDITPKAVSSRLERAREKLRQLIAKNLSHET
jgi:RNA polymerase sigma factor (sigma-70 family)